MDERRYRTGAVSAWVGLVTNFLLAVIKIAAGVLARSNAMLADGVHSVADLVGSGAVVIGFGVARRPADDCHPYGHDKAETISAAVVAIVLIVAGLNVALAALRTLVSGHVPLPGLLALWAGLISIVVKEALFRYKIHIGRQIDSKAVIANAWEHRSDAITSVAAVLGVAGARAGYPWVDPLTALLVSCLVLRWGWLTARSAVDDLMDRIVDPAAVRRIHSLAGNVAGVVGVNDVRARYVGANILVDLKIGVDPHISVEEGHQIAHLVRKEIVEGMPRVKDVMVHVDPVPPALEGL